MDNDHFVRFSLSLYSIQNETQKKTAKENRNKLTYRELIFQNRNDDLLCFKLLANAVRNDLTPIDFGTRNR